MMRGRGITLASLNGVNRQPRSRMERKWWTLLAVCVATFMLLLDVTIVNVALPSIERELDAGLTKLQWVVDAYTLVLSALILTAGALAASIGRPTGLAFSVAALTIPAR